MTQTIGPVNFAWHQITARYFSVNPPGILTYIFFHFVICKFNPTCIIAFMPIKSILNHIRRLGYHVSVHRVNGTVEMLAVKFFASEAPQIARCDDGDGVDETYRCACLLATAVGIELEDG